MKHLKLLTASVAFSFTLLTGCQKEIDTTVQPLAAKQLSQLSATSQEKIKQLRASLPAGVKEKLKQRSALLLKTDPQYRDMVLRAMAVEPTTCDTTLVDRWLKEQLASWNEEVIGYVFDYAILDLPAYYALYFENSSQNQYFGVDGRYTQRMTKTFKGLQRFWNIKSDDIVLVAMHGNMLRDRNKIIKTYVAAFDEDPATAATLADIVVELTRAIPQFRNGNHPLFTFNAFAQEGFDFPPYGVVPDKIVIGDGFTEAFTAIGFGDIEPEATLAHEFGHHIQFELGLLGDGYVASPEATRRLELMADAYAAYYLYNIRGASRQFETASQFWQSSFNTGDCQFSSNSHHGTPAQKMAAAKWASTLAIQTQKLGRIFTSQEFTKYFDAQLPKIVKQPEFAKR